MGKSLAVLVGNLLPGLTEGEGVTYDDRVCRKKIHNVWTSVPYYVFGILLSRWKV